MANFDFLSGLESSLQDYFKQQPTQLPQNQAMPGATDMPAPAPMPMPTPQGQGMETGGLEQFFQGQAMNSAPQAQNPMAQGAPSSDPQEIFRLGMLEYLKQLTKFFKQGTEPQSTPQT